MSKRMPPALVLSAVLFVTFGFAATKKIQHNDTSGDWNDWSFRAASLVNAGSSVSGGWNTLPSGFENASLLKWGNFGSSPVPKFIENPDRWLGGVGNWDDYYKWDNGVPTDGNQVYIESNNRNGDRVTLDVSATVQQLYLGQNSPLPVSGWVLTDDGQLRTLTITSGLHLRQGGHLSFSGGSTLSVEDVLNSGTIGLQNKSTLMVSGNVINSASLGTGGSGGNTVNITGYLNNAIPGLGGGPTPVFVLGGSGDIATIGGNVTNSTTFEVLSKSTATIGGNLTNNSGGLVDVEDGSTLHIKGAVTNSAGGSGFGIFTSFYGTGGNTLNIDGMLTNSGNFQLNGPGDVATVGSLTNSGEVDLDKHSSLDVDGGHLTNYGVINVKNGSAVVAQYPGTLINLGTINIDSMSTFLVGTGNHGLGYIQLANGTLGEMIDSYSSFGVINVNGSALLAGTLDILLQDGFNPILGSKFKFLIAAPGQVSGSFSVIYNDLFNCNDKTCEYFYPLYDRADGYVELVVEEKTRPASEPATLLVLIPGLLGVGYGLRRKLLG